jgi:transglutaminase-like putative cysteine protease
MYRWRPVVFQDWEAKANYLDGAAWIDARLPFVRDIARRFAKACNPNNFQALAWMCFRFCRDRIRYVPDPASEEFSDSQQILEQGFGDCDDKTRLFVALCRSLRLEARIRPVLQRTAEGDDFVHVQAQVRWPGSSRTLKSGEGGWVTAEVILKDCELGDEPQDARTLLLA